MTKQQTEAMLADNGGAALQMIAHKKLQAQIKNVLEDYELNLTQWLIISRLDEVQEGLRTTDLARFMHVEVPLVTMMSRPLRTRGLITTTSKTPDRREKLLRVTAQAKKIVDAVESKIESQLANMVQGVSPRDIQSYFKVLQNIVASPA
jgi:MarR family transcriptional regulator for hemolysin